MNNSFLDESKDVANQFIKNVLFVDDQIKWGENIDKHDLNAKILIHNFANHGKSCTFYNVEEEKSSSDDCEAILKITPNSDVIILDWKMKHEKIGAAAGIASEDLEEDVEEEESRGKFTLLLLNKLVEKYKNSLKLILILTGEIGGNDILDAIHRDEHIAEFEKDETDLSLIYEKIKISIYFKPGLDRSHLSDTIQNKLLKNYESLPDRIDTEFASFTGGLISNTALKTISVIRDNASKLLKVYRKELDPAYLAHRALLGISEDAEHLLKDTILHSISNLITTNHISDKCDVESIDKWLQKEKNTKMSNISISSQEINLNSKYRQLLIESSFPSDFIKTIKSIFTEEKVITSLAESAVEKYRKKLEKDTILDFGRKVVQKK